MTFSHSTAPTRFIDVDGIRYAYRKFGGESGTPLLFLQHFRGGLDHWDPLVTDALASDRPVILFNNAGVASSTGTPADTIDGMAIHVAKFLDALGITRVDVLGFSVGGFVAQRLTINRPELVRRLILAGTGPEGGEDIGHLDTKVIEHATRDLPTLDDILFLFFRDSERSLAAGRTFWKRRNARSDQDTLSSSEVTFAQSNAIASWGAIPPTRRYHDLSHIRQPVLVVNGDNDVMVPTVNSIILQRHLPRGTLILYPDSGHGAIFQFPELFVSHAKLFLDQGMPQ